MNSGSAQSEGSNGGGTLGTNPVPSVLQRIFEVEAANSLISPLGGGDVGGSGDSEVAHLILPNVSQHQNGTTSALLGFGDGGTDNNRAPLSTPPVVVAEQDDER